MNSWHMIVALVLCAPCSLATGAPQSPLQTLIDPATTTLGTFGACVANLGDLNGDGLGEIAVSDVTASLSAVTIFSSANDGVVRRHNSTHSDQRLGRAVASIGDVDGDGVPDYAIGADGWDVAGPQPLTDAGMFMICSGASGATLRTVVGPSANKQMGYSIAAAGDVDGDAVPDLIVGSPGGGAWVYAATGSLIHSIPAPATNDRFGCAVTGLGDLNNDGRCEFAVGAAQQSPTNGYVRVYNGFDKSLRYTVTGPASNSRFGTCIRSIGDLDGDGRRELVVGAPLYFGTHSGQGLVRVFSGFNGGFIRSIEGTHSSENFGTSIDTGADIDGDGYDDLVVGAPHAGNMQLSNAGAARAVSGASGLTLFEVRGTETSANLGLSVAWVSDHNGDGVGDFVAGGPREELRGAAVIFSSRCAAPFAYCAAKVNSLGCTPSIWSTGRPSLSATDDFHIRVANVLNNKPGLMFYGFRPVVTPLFGGLLCVGQGIRRTPGQSSGGNPPPIDCSGTYDFFFRQATLIGDNLAIGQTLYAQVWSRDSGYPAPNNVGLSDGLQFTICD